jgi:hypothetical protein
VFENRVVRRILGPKVEEASGLWRKLYNEELHNLHSSPNIVRVGKSGRIRSWHSAHTAEILNAYRILFGKPEAKTALGRPRRR